MENILDLKSPLEFRKWLENNSINAKECYLELKRGKPGDDGCFYYLDAVEVALCFGWIDSTLRRINDKLYQRFSKRSKSSSWTELNKERVRRLEKLGLMTDMGRNVLPNMDYVEPSKDFIKILKKNDIYDIFISFPKLYQRIRYDNLNYSKEEIVKNKKHYETSLNNFIKNTKLGKMYGVWDDYGRLSNY